MNEPCENDVGRGRADDRMASEAGRNEAEQFRRLAEETREVRDRHREALETIRQEREHLRNTAETSRIASEEARNAAETARTASEEARVATDDARQVVVDAVRTTADALNASLEQMQVVEERLGVVSTTEQRALVPITHSWTQRGQGSKRRRFHAPIVRAGRPIRSRPRVQASGRHLAGEFTCCTPSPSSCWSRGYSRRRLCHSNKLSSAPVRVFTGPWI